jgi:hypothetical protein
MMTSESLCFVFFFVGFFVSAEIIYIYIITMVQMHEYSYFLAPCIVAVNKINSD